MKIVFSTHGEEQDRVKIENCTVAEIKKKILSLLEQFSTKTCCLTLTK